jgi:hypothetical protein
MNTKLIEDTIREIERDLEIDFEIVLYTKVEYLLKEIWQDGYLRALGRFNNPDVG